MAVTYDNATSYSLVFTGESSSSFSHTVGTGSNRCLLALLGRSSGFGNTPSSVTYGGVSMSLLGTVQNAGFNTELFVYGLLAPASGSASLAVSWGVGTRGGIVAISFDTVDPATPYGTLASGTSGSVTATSATGGLVVDIFATDTGDSFPLTAGGGQTQRINFVGSSGASGAATGIGVSTKPGAASVSMAWTGYNSAIQIAVPLNAAAGITLVPYPYAPAQRNRRKTGRYL